MCAHAAVVLTVFLHTIDRFVWNVSCLPDFILIRYVFGLSNSLIMKSLGVLINDASEVRSSTITYFAFITSESISDRII